MEVKENKKTSDKINSFLEKNRKGLLIVLVAAVVVIAGFSVCTIITSKTAEKTLSAVEEISYNLTEGSAGLEGEELEAKCAKALEDLAPYFSKGGVAGASANRLAAEIAFQKKDYEGALAYWTASAEKNKKAYTAPLAYFNMGVCCEELGKVAEAEANYKKAADFENFILKAHALFSLGRIYEAQGKFAEAAEAYKTANDKCPDDSWSFLAKSRLIDLKIQGKIE